MVGVDDDHLGRAACCAAGFDRACGTVPDFQKAHEARRLTTAGQRLTLTAQVAEVCAGTRPIFEEARLTHPKIHDTALVHQIVRNALNKASVRLRMLVRRGGAGQLARRVIHVVVALSRTIDAVGPVQAGVEPLRAVGRCHLSGEHMAHLVKVCLRVSLAGKVAALPAPVRPSPGQTVKDLLSARLTAKRRVLGGY